MNMYLYELKSLRKSTLIWTLSLVALAFIYFSIYPSIASDAEDFKQLLSAYPEPIRAALGISLESITSLLGFYSMVFSIISLTGAIQAMILGTSILSKEARDRTADFLLVKPVSRTSIISAKLSAAITILLITNILYDLIAFIMASVVATTDYSKKQFFLISLTLFFIQLIFLAVGLFLSVFFQKLRSVLPISLGVVFGLYMIGAILATGEKDVARYLSPFKYFNIPYIMEHSGYETSYLFVSAIIVVISIVGSYLVYSKKDIHAVS
ncbi:MAG: hypothetical protein K0S47_1051 [Herbinix sp.]|jgi:ABC-2 type transport system permease protein|nr:hypothetical protein [Herbinix sp.]